MKDKLKKRLERAFRYLEIVDKIRTQGQYAQSELNWIQANSKLLQKEMQKLDYGIIFYRRPFGLGIFPRYQIIANFPVMLQTRGLTDEAVDLIPTVIQELQGYIQELKENVELPEKMKEKKSEIEFLTITDDIFKNFRKNVIKEPQNEKDIQDYLEGFLAVKEYEFKREMESTAFSTKSFKPDFTNKKLKIAIEVKYVDNKNKVNECVEGMSADIKPYSKKWKNILFLVYDKGGNIRDVDDFTKDFNQNNNILIRCIVIKH